MSAAELEFERDILRNRLPSEAVLDTLAKRTSGTNDWIPVSLWQKLGKETRWLSAVHVVRRWREVEAERHSTVHEYEQVANRFKDLYPNLGLAWEQLKRTAEAIHPDGEIVSLITTIRCEVSQILMTIVVASGNDLVSSARIYQAIFARLTPDDYLTLEDCTKFLSRLNREPLGLSPTLDLLRSFDKLSGNDLASHLADAYAQLVILACGCPPRSFAVEAVKAQYLELLKPYVLASEIFDQGWPTRSNLCEECRKSCNLLGVRREATREEVKVAFRDLAKVWHPDRFAATNERVRLKAEVQMQAINQAFTHLEAHKTEDDPAVTKSESRKGDYGTDPETRQSMSEPTGNKGDNALESDEIPITPISTSKYFNQIALESQSQKQLRASSKRRIVLFFVAIVFLGSGWWAHVYRASTPESDPVTTVVNTRDTSSDKTIANKASAPSEIVRQAGQNSIQDNQDIISQSSETDTAQTQQPSTDVSTNTAGLQDTAIVTEEDLGVRAYNQGKYDEAFPHFMHAAIAGNAQADSYLGYMYEYGRGVQENDIKAVQWFSKAVAAGDESARISLEGAQELVNLQKAQASQSSTVPREIKADSFATNPANNGYETYRNARFGFAIDFPESFVLRGQHQNNQDGILLVSRDGLALFTVIGRNNPGRPLKDWYDASIKNVRGVLGYHILAGNWFVISWTEDTKIYYLKMFVGSGSQNSFTFICPTDQKTECEAITTRMEKSFVPGNIKRTW